jgi:zinc/manganese transport system permease protein
MSWSLRIAAVVLALGAWTAAAHTRAPCAEPSPGEAAALEELRRAARQEAGDEEAGHAAGDDHDHGHHGHGQGAERTEVSAAAVLRFFALQISLVAVVLVLHTYIGLHVVRRVLVFSDLVLDQLAAFGAMAGIGLGIAYGSAGSYLLSLAAVLVGALLLAAVRPRGRTIPREAVIGTMYALALVASLLLADKLSGGDAHVAKTLSGCIEWVSWPLVVVTASVYAALLLFHFLFRKRFVALAEGRAPAGGEGLWDFLFFSTQGIITVLIVPVAGVLLAYAFLMIPAAIAAMFTRGWGRGLALGWGVGFAACLVGLTGSFVLNLPYGPSLVLALGLAFVGALLVRGLRPPAGATPGGLQA